MQGINSKEQVVVVVVVVVAAAAVVIHFSAVLLAKGQYLEGPATGHLGTGFARFPCVCL